MISIGPKILLNDKCPYCGFMLPRESKYRFHMKCKAFNKDKLYEKSLHTMPEFEQCQETQQMKKLFSRNQNKRLAIMVAHAVSRDRAIASFINSKINSNVKEKLRKELLDGFSGIKWFELGNFTPGDIKTYLAHSGLMIKKKLKLPPNIYFIIKPLEGAVYIDIFTAKYSMIRPCNF